MKFSSLIFCCLILLLPSQLLAGQACSEELLPSAPAENFRVNPDGTVLGRNTGLIWMRCSLGQQLVGDSCQGEPTSLTWQEALQQADSFQFAGRSDWRLPDKNELESLVELRCSSPAINAELFPSTPAAFYWTSSPYSGVGDGAWSVDFAYGSVVASVKSGKNYVRLVRDR